jgi:hypothetical protein
MKQEAMQWLDAITSGGVPVEWDRVTDDDEAIKVYGWILRPDGKRDFVLVRFDEDTIEFTTSSAKHSAEIGRLLCYEKGEHHPCIPFATFFKGVHVTEESRKAIKAMQDPKGD